ncbi:oxidized low-density lipoprotein receptor 1-like isoform X2 [Hemitrygon akajei]|uniref:oxidized low-density lipoprotein receptor 1-like isoform X2 n=1 Tax=Hemitrygon akajei TaxID=2704970 RepID=UPI003BF97802
MYEDKTYVNVKFAKTDPQSPSNDGMGSERPTRRDRSDPSIWLTCLLTAALIITGICWRIHVSQIRHCNITSDRNCHGLNSTVESKLSALNSNLSHLKRMHSELRHRFKEMETKYRYVNQAKAQICELLTSRREENCSKVLVRYGDRCYFFSTFETSYDGAREFCSIIDSSLLKINSEDEANFVNKAVHDQGSSYWIGKCEDGGLKCRVQEDRWEA